MASIDDAMQGIMDAVGQRVKTRFKQLIRSKTLNDSVFYVADFGAQKVQIIIPYYWAEFYLNGHGVIHSSKGRDKGWMVWFADPKDDPRLRGGPARTRAERKHLTREQWKIGLEINRERKGSGLPPFMYYSREVPASRGSGDIDPVYKEVPQIVREEASRGMKEYIREVLREDMRDL